jgi:uncharacterized MAPEG superfamily protein
MNVLIAPLGAGALVAISALVQHLNTVISKGLGFVFTDRSTPLSRDGFAGRAARTLQNNLESAAMVAPAALVIAITRSETEIITTTALIYLAARLGFTVFYWYGVNVTRSISWATGMIAIAILTYCAIQALIIN